MINNIKITGIVAANPDNIIAIDNKMPWGKIETDLQFYKKMTLGKTLIVGKKTYDTLPKKAKEGRTYIVISSNASKVKLHNDDIAITCDFNAETIIDTVQSKLSDEVIIVGGGTIYKLFEDYYDDFYYTSIGYPTPANGTKTYIDLNFINEMNDEYTTEIIDQFIENELICSIHKLSKK